MSEKTEITFMQTRLIRLASEEWHLPVEQIIHLFKEADVLGYIEKCYGIFHCEGDEAVLEDITEFLQRNGKVLLLILPGLSGQQAIRKQTISALDSCCPIN